MKKPLNYYGYAFDDPKEGYNEEFLKSKKGKKEIKKQKKYNRRLKKQLKEQGFDDSECWNLDETIARFILPRIKKLKEITHGYPGDLKNEHEWDEILDRIARAFEIIIEDDFDLKVNKEYTEGMKLFAKYYRNLWS